MSSCSSRRRALILAVTLLSLHTRRAAASTPYATWLYPADDTETFYYRDQIDVSYECRSDASSYLVVNCIQGVGDVQQQQVAPGGDATVGITLQLSNGSSYSEDEDLSCWFDLRNVSGYAGVAEGTNSPAWNYIHTERNGGPATLALPSSSSSSSTTSSSTTSASASSTAATTTSKGSTAAPSATDAADAATATATTTATPHGGAGGLSVGAGVAIGVSVGILAVAVPLVSVVLIRRQRRRRQQLGELRRRVGFDEGGAQPPPAGFKFGAPEPPGYSYLAGGKDSPRGGAAGGSYPLGEMPPAREVHELYGSQAGEEMEAPVSRR